MLAVEDLSACFFGMRGSCQSFAASQSSLVHSWPLYRAFS